MSGTDDLAEALRQFDRVAANVNKLEGVWEMIAQQTPPGIEFGADTPQVDDLRRAFEELAAALPPIDGFRINARPWPFDEMAQARLDAQEVGFPEAIAGVEQDLNEPAKELGEYKYRLHAVRRSMVRRHVEEVINEIDTLLANVTPGGGKSAGMVRKQWETLSGLVSRLDRLVGETVPGRARWNDLRRHLHFAQSNDLSDIKTMDWPSVRSEVEATLYNDLEPLPISVQDLVDVVQAQPSGPVGTRLAWEALSPEDFERLLFELIASSPGYENANWLMRTNAADKGRDVEVYRVGSDVLAGTRRHRVIAQCKHGLARTVGRDELVQCAEAVTLWEPPPIDVLIIATSGRFSQDAVAKAEQRTERRSIPTVELWPDSHLETVLARRPDLTARYGLR